MILVLLLVGLLLSRRVRNKTQVLDQSENEAYNSITLPPIAPAAVLASACDPPTSEGSHPPMATANIQVDIAKPCTGSVIIQGPSNTSAGNENNDRFTALPPVAERPKKYEDDDRSEATV